MRTAIPFFSTAQVSTTPAFASFKLRKLLDLLQTACLPNITSYELIAGYEESSHVIIVVLPEKSAKNIADCIDEVFFKDVSLNHLFPAQVRYFALGELCRGINVELDAYFKKTRDVHHPFADVLFLPDSWRTRVDEFQTMYFSTTPYYLRTLSGREVLCRT